MKDINKLVNSYCKSIYNSVQRKYCGRSNSHSWKNYPAVAIVCTDYSGIYSRGTSNKANKKFYASTQKFCGNKIGYCAEPHAARSMLIKHSCKLEKLFFSKAQRPRTMEYIKFCKNCKRTFPNL